MRKFLLKFLAVSAFLICFFCSEIFALTWPETLKLDNENNELKSAQKQVEVARWLYQRAYLAFLPQVSASLSLSNSNPGSIQSYAYGLSATQPIFKGLASYYALQSAETDYHYYEAALKNTNASVYYQMRTAFIDLLIGQNNYELQKQILERRKRNTRLIKLRYESGREDKGNLMSTQADQASSEYSVSSAARDLRVKKNKMLDLLGQKVDAAEENINIAAVVPLDFENLLKSTPALKMAEYQLKSAEIAQKATISGFLPSVSLSASLRKSGGSWPPDSDSNSWSLNLSYPFFPGGSNLADAKIYDLRLAKSRLDFEKSQKDLRYNLEMAYENFQDTVESRAVKTISLAAAQERAKIAQAKYINGLLTYDEWDRIENAYISAQINLLNSEQAALKAEAAWHNSYGGWVK